MKDDVRQEIHEEIDRTQFQSVERYFKKRRVMEWLTRALDAAIIAANFSEVGAAFGFDGKTAERQGKSITLAAAKKLESALQKIAA